MYKYSDRNNISLHDCRATKILLIDNTLSFVFKDGFFVSENSEYNHLGKLAYTDGSEVRFDLPDKKAEADITVYVYSKSDAGNISIREEIPFRKFAEDINSGMELEFLYSYTGGGSFIFNCWLWFDAEPYHKECELIIFADEVRYFWNNLFADDV